jgi:hypothetical protein
MAPAHVTDCTLGPTSLDRFRTTCAVHALPVIVRAVVYDRGLDAYGIYQVLQAKAITPVLPSIPVGVSPPCLRAQRSRATPTASRSPRRAPHAPTPSQRQAAPSPLSLSRETAHPPGGPGPLDRACGRVSPPGPGSAAHPDGPRRLCADGGCSPALSAHPTRQEHLYAVDGQTHRV